MFCFDSVGTVALDRPLDPDKRAGMISPASMNQTIDYNRADSHKLLQIDGSTGIEDDGRAARLYRRDDYHQHSQG